MYSIYRITCLKTEKSYVGKTNDINRRWEAHRRTLRNGKHHSHKLQQAYIEHGEDAFKYEILETDISVEDVPNREAHWVNQYDCLQSGYNVRFVTHDREHKMPRNRRWNVNHDLEHSKQVDEYELIRKQVGEAYAETLEEIKDECLYAQGQRDLLRELYREAREDIGGAWQVIGYLEETMRKNGVSLPNVHELFERFRVETKVKKAS